MKVFNFERNKLNFCQLEIQNRIEVLIIEKKSGIWIGEIILICIKLFTKLKKKTFYIINLRIGGVPH